MNTIEKIGIGIVLLIAAVILFIPREATPLIPLSPQINSTTFESKPTFHWLGQASELLIDDNPSFTSPARLNVNGKSSAALSEPLKPGTYYWKLQGKNETGILEFTIQGKAGIQIEQSGIGTLLKNTGNVDLKVIVDTVKQAPGITGALIIPVGKNRLLPKIFPKNVEASPND